MTDKVEFSYARRNIDPPFPMGLAGYFNLRVWEKILDSLEVRVVAFRQEKQLALLIQYDLIVCPPPMFGMLKNALAEAGFGDAVLLVTATHTHTAPEVRIGRAGYEEAYLPFAVQATVEAVKEAVQSLTACTMETTTVMEGTCCFNRRFWMKDGSVQSNPGKLNPDIVRAEGEIDPEIPMLRFTSATGKTLVIANISNHADTTGGSNVSGDWPGWTRRLVETELPADAMVIPLIGCSGDINHFDVTIPGAQTEPAEAERIGRAYAKAVIGGLAKFVPAESSLACRNLSLTVPPREIAPEELAEAHRIMEEYKDLEFTPATVQNLTAEDLAKKSPVVLKYFAQSLIAVAENPKTSHFELSLLDFGTAAILGVPCEPFAAAGLIIRKVIFGNTFAMVGVLNNGSGTGYIPNAWNYGRGGYETTPRSNPISIHAMELLLDAVAKIKKGISP